MRRLLPILCIISFSLPALAKSWAGMTPGKTTRTQVINNFGKPTKTFSKGGKLSDGLNYQGDEAIKGSLEANIYFDKYEMLYRIDVFPAKEIKHTDIIKIYGKNFKKMQTPKGHLLLHYATEGMVVFFDKTGKKVHSFMFVKGQEPEQKQAEEKKKPKEKRAADEEENAEPEDVDEGEDIESEGLLD